MMWSAQKLEACTFQSTGILCGSVRIFETELDSWLGLILAAGDSNRKWISENGDT